MKAEMKQTENKNQGFQVAACACKNKLAYA